MGRKSRSERGSSAPAWMATFADMMSLLLTFFVLLLSFAEMDIVKFKDAMGSINEALGFMRTGKTMFHHSSRPAPFDRPITPAEPKSSQKAILKELEEFIIKNGLNSTMEVADSERGVILNVRGKMIFKPGTADLTYESMPVLEKISELMKKYPGRVSIEGHTDNIPITSSTYSSNWELSTARAYAALKHLHERGKISVKSIHIAGYGDLQPLISNDTPEGRAKNRRVEFVFYK